MHFSAEDVVRLCVFLVLGLLLVFVALTWYTGWVLSHPYRRTYASALAKGRAGEPGELLRGDGTARAFSSWELNWNGAKLPVWDVVGDDPAGPAFVLSHGWGDSRIGGLTRLEHLAPMASRVVLWDMPGHGEAPGVCSLGTREVGALLALIEQVGTPVVLYGWSLGAGVSIAAAVEGGKRSEPANSLVKAVIAEAPYCLPITPARNVLGGWGLPNGPTLSLALAVLGVRFGVGARWGGFDRSILAVGMDQPLLVIHGKNDEVCPWEDGERIVKAVRNSVDSKLVLLPGAGHHGLWTEGATAELCRGAVAGLVGRLRTGEDLKSGHAQQSHG